MIPLRDINPVRSTPFVNYLLILANVAAFVWMVQKPIWYETGYALVPARLAADPLGEVFTVFTSMFMHESYGWHLDNLTWVERIVSLQHIAGNMLFLWIFGDNVEDAMGHGRYLFFYLFSGVIAASVQVAMTLGSSIPVIGASGAIAGVIGAYMLLYPRAPILILNPIFWLWLFWGLTLTVPAWFVAAEFFVMNVFMGVQTLHSQGAGAATGGVAVFAHIGGFIAGLVAVGPLSRGRERPQHRAWAGWRSPSERRAR
jgi:membrane associated rhomboid family serine protease